MFLSLEEAAEILIIPEETLLEYLQKGRIKGVKDGRQWKIPEEAIKEFIHPTKEQKPLIVYTTWKRIAHVSRQYNINLPSVDKDIPARLSPLEVNGAKIPCWLEVEILTSSGDYEPCTGEYEQYFVIEDKRFCLVDWIPDLQEKYNREGVAVPEEILHCADIVGFELNEGERRVRDNMIITRFNL